MMLFISMHAQYSPLVSELDDAVRGDGERLCQVWKYLTLLFHSNGRTKYALEALTLQLQLHGLPPYLYTHINLYFVSPLYRTLNSLLSMQSPYTLSLLFLPNNVRIFMRCLVSPHMQMSMLRWP